MKIRSGFVSNSSSSSYVLILKEEDHKKLVSQLDPFAKYLVKYLGWKKGKMGEESVRTLAWTAGNYNSFEYITEEGDDKLNKLARKYAQDKGMTVPPEDDDYENSNFAWDVLFECWDDFEKLAGKHGLIVDSDF